MSLYLSRLILNAEHPRSRSELERPYEMHRTLSKAWVDLPTARVLFRPEQESRRVAAVIVQSAASPDWSRLTAPRDYLARVDGPKHVSLEELQQGRCLHFRLRCCPSKRVWRPESVDHGRRHALTAREDVFAWLHRKAESCGLHIDEAAFDRVYWQHTKNGQNVKLTGVVFDGVVTVTDPGLTRSAIARGIGPAKAFGFGLLSVAPVRS